MRTHVSVFLLACLAATFLIVQMERARVEHERAVVLGYAKDHAHELEVYIERALSATYALAALVQAGNGNIPHFNQVAEQMLPSYPGASELALLVGGKVRDVAPLEGNEKALGLDVLSSPAQQNEAALARDSGKLTLAGPFELVQGGFALAGRLPVFLPDSQNDGASFWGFTEVVMRLPEALVPAQLSQLVASGYAYRLWRINPQGHRRQVIDASARELDHPVEQTLRVPNGTWTLSVAPARGWGDPMGLALKVALGVLFAALLAWLAGLLLDLRTRGEQLEALVTRRTADMARDIAKRKRAERAARRSRTRLSVTLDAAKIAIWDWDLKRDRWRASPIYFTNLGYQPEAGQPDPDLWLERVHPEDRPKVAAAIQDTLAGRSSAYEYEARLRHADGSYRWTSVRGKVVRRDKQGAAKRMLGVRIDITEQKEAEERILRLAHFDSLTGLPNRTLFNDRMAYALAMAARKEEPLAVLVVNVDKFKNINDTFGHRIGDELLMEVSRRMRSIAREDDIVARVGGDEFVMTLPGIDANRAAHTAQQLLALLAKQYKTRQLELSVTCSIGIAMYPGDGRDLDTLLKCADTAMHRAKDEGRNHYVFCTAEMQITSARNLLLENALQRATERHELQLHYQPLVSLVDGHITGAEALLRWTHPDLGSVSPAEFIPIAEDSGQIVQLGEWVLRTAVMQLRSWLDAGLPSLTLAVNLSSVQLRHPNLAELISRTLAEANLTPACLELELTETVAMGDPLGAIRVTDHLHELGIHISIDDFGTGYSSLNYLKRFRASRLKIDRTFVSGVTDDAEDRGIVAAIINLAGSLGLETVAEGVETAGQLAYLKSQGCHKAQGFFFSEPLPAAQFASLARNTTRQSTWLNPA